MIVEEKLDGWNNNLIKTDEVIYPQSKDDKAPKIIFLVFFAVLVEVGKVIYLQNY